VRRGLLALALLLAAAAAAAFSSANFSASSGNPSNAVTTATVGAASGLTAGASGRDVNVAWTAGTNASSAVVSGGPSQTSSCAGVTYTQLATPSPATYTDANRSSPAGSWYCYRVQAAFHSFSSLTTSPTVATQLGVVASAATLANNGASSTSGCSAASSGALDCRDRIVIDFNQAIDTGSGPGSSGKVCGDETSASILIGYTGFGTCASSGYSIGKLKGSWANNSARYDATFTWSNGNTRLTVDLGIRRAGTSDMQLSGGSWSFTPASGLTSSTGAVGICTSVLLCQPLASGSL
jgi:hypothetical protein